MPRTAEVGFSGGYKWDLKMGSLSVEVPFSGMKFTHNISGFGTKGVVTGQFEFDLYDIYGIYSNAFLEHMEVHLEEKDNAVLPSKKFYIARRSVNNNICHFVAYDNMYRTDQEFNSSPLNVFFDKGLNASCGNVIDEIKQQCGFEGVGASAPGLEFIQFTKEQLSNRTCRAILEEIAKIMCGVWITTRENELVLSCLGDTVPNITYSKKYSEINYQGRQKITKLIFVDSDSGYQREFYTGEYGTVIEIKTSLVPTSPDFYTIVWDRVRNYIYQAWSCKKILSGVSVVEPFPESTSHIIFGETELVANKIKVMPDSTGIYISASCDPQDDEQWKYDDYLTRTKIGINESVGNMTIKNTGRIVYFPKNKGGDTSG